MTERRGTGTAVLTWADRLLMYALVGSGIVLLAAARGGGAGGLARLQGEDGYSRVVRLDREARYEVAGPLGVSVVEVRGGQVRMATSPCPGRICVSMGAARRPGDSIVCVPNGVLVTVLGGTGSTADAVTR